MYVHLMKRLRQNKESDTPGKTLIKAANADHYR